MSSIQENRADVSFWVEKTSFSDCGVNQSLHSRFNGYNEIINYFRAWVEVGLISEQGWYKEIGLKGLLYPLPGLN